MATLPPSTAGLSAFQRAVKEAWNQRSDGEKEAWRAECQSMASAPEVAASERQEVAKARQRGALSGWVKPLDLLHGLSVENDHALLDSIAISFDRSRSGGGWRWQMRAGARASVFRGLVDPNDAVFAADLNEAVADAGAVPTDLAGDQLRAVIAAGGLVDPAGLAADPGETPAERRVRLEALLQALGWAGIAAAQKAFPPEPVQAARDAVRRELATAICASNCMRLLEAGFYGYERELARLGAFAVEAFDDPRVPVLPLEGVGGAGKSTLLAALVRSELGRDDPAGAGPIIVQADFDRLIFRNGGELELSFEVARQIGVQVPEVDQPLRRLHDEKLAQRASLSEEMKQESAALESLIRIAASFDYEAGNVLRGANVDKRPVLLLLDTFEEWRRPGSEPQAPSQRLVRLVDWIGTLKSQMGLTGLRVIVSGRVTLDKDVPALKLMRPIRLKGIGRPQAKKLLRGRGLGSREADRLLELIGGGSDKRWIPLTLHIAERMVRDLEPDERERFLEGDDVIGGDLDEAVRQGTLYKRYLEHMGQGDVRKVALPGLALRRVTVPIIQHVLAGPCDLGEVDQARAEALFAQLEREVWLVQRDGDALVHRSDIRSVMMRMMVEDPALTEKLAALHEAAIHWYSAGDGRLELPEDAARQEALYHELALLPDESDLPHLTSGEPISSRDQADLRVLLPAREDFGPRLAAQLRFAVEEWVPREEARHLPEASRDAYVREHGQRLVRRGDAGPAVRFFEETGGKEPQWLAQAQVDAVRWQDRLGGADPYVERLDEKGPELAMSVRLKHHVLRAFLAGDEAGLERITALVNRGAEASIARPPRSSMTTAVDTLFFLLVSLGVERLRTLAPALPAFLTTLAREGRGGRRTFDDWMRGVVVGRAFALDEDVIEALCVTSSQVVVAGMLRPNPDLLQEYRRALEPTRSSAALEAVDLYGGRLASGTALSTHLLFDWPAEATQKLKEQGGVTRNPLLHLPPGIDLLRVGDPELRPAIRAAFAHAFDKWFDYEHAGQLLAPVMPVVPVDFGPSHADEDWQRSGQMLVRIVEYLDRAGVMGPAIERVVAWKPGDPLLEKVQGGYVRWDRASRALMAGLVGDTATA